MSAIPFVFTPETHTFMTPDGPRLSVTQILAKNGICDFSFVDQETRLYSMDRGSKVHWLTELEDGGGLNYRTVPKWLRGFRKGWNTWKRRSSFQINSIEERFVSRFGYAGIIDRTGMFPPSVNDAGIAESGDKPLLDRIDLERAAVCLPIRLCRHH